MPHQTQLSLFSYSEYDYLKTYIPMLFGFLSNMYKSFDARLHFEVAAALRLQTKQTLDILLISLLFHKRAASGQHIHTTLD